MALGGDFGRMVRKELSEAELFIEISKLSGFTKGTLCSIFMIKILLTRSQGSRRFAIEHRLTFMIGI